MPRRERPPQIHTLTGNLLWEQTLEFRDWAPGRTQRAASVHFQVGGKGINVSRMLNRLGSANTALCFPGGLSGSACTTWLKESKITFRAFPAAGATRVGTVVRGGSRPETTFLGPDVSPGKAALRACAAYLDGRPDGDILAISGSLPGWDTSDFDPLRAALERWARRATLVADTYGAPLAWLVERPVELVKINRDEFDAFSAGWGAGGRLAARLRDARHRFRARSWVVTDGGGPVAFIDGSDAAGRVVPPAVREVSPTGSGDVLLACILHARTRLGLALGDAVAYAAPFAAANAADPGIAEFPWPPPGK